MRRNPGVWILSALLMLPLAWLAATTDIWGGGRALLLFGGALVTALVVLRLAWRAHRAGTLLPNRCRTCGNPMVHTSPESLRPPEGADPPSRGLWRCRHCGRLE
ncbi:MAG: hypothetical protein ACQEXJ_08840 [Myxococcota bacterium]